MNDLDDADSRDLTAINAAQAALVEAERPLGLQWFLMQNNSSMENGPRRA